MSKFAWFIVILHLLWTLGIGITTGREARYNYHARSDIVGLESKVKSLEQEVTTINAHRDSGVWCTDCINRSHREAGRY